MRAVFIYLSLRFGIYRLISSPFFRGGVPDEVGTEG
jgi:hypothetical protein